MLVFQSPASSRSRTSKHQRSRTKSEGADPAPRYENQRRCQRHRLRIRRPPPAEGVPAEGAERDAPPGPRQPPPTERCRVPRPPGRRAQLRVRHSGSAGAATELGRAGELVFPSSRQRLSGQPGTDPRWHKHRPAGPRAVLAAGPGTARPAAGAGRGLGGRSPRSGRRQRPETFRGGEGAGSGRGAARRPAAARPLPVLAAGLVDVPVGASAHFAALVLEQVLHPLALGRQLRLELVVHVSPMGGEGRAGDAAAGSTPPAGGAPSRRRHFRGSAAAAGGRLGRGGAGNAFVFVLVWGFSAGGGGALRRRPLQLGSRRRGAARGVPGVVVRLRAPAPAARAGRGGGRTTTPGMPPAAPAGPRRRTGLPGDTEPLGGRWELAGSSRRGQRRERRGSPGGRGGGGSARSRLRGTE